MNSLKNLHKKIDANHKDCKDQILGKECSDIEIESSDKSNVHESNSQNSIDEIFGLWKGRRVRIEKIREQQWQRKTK